MYIFIFLKEVSYRHTTVEPVSDKSQFSDVLLGCKLGMLHSSIVNTTSTDKKRRYLMSNVNVKDARNILLGC